jgi:hypothetical protein
MRRYLLGLAVVFSNKIIYQQLAAYFGTFAHFVLIGAEVYLNRQVRRNEIFNESIILLTIYTITCFTNWTPDLKT